MLDLKLLREHPELVAARLALRGYALNVSLFQELEMKRKNLQAQTQTLQNNRNLFAKEIGQKKSKGEEVEALIQASELNNQNLELRENELNAVQQELEAFCMDIPNLPHESVPHGKNEKDNVEIRRWGVPQSFDFLAKDHVDLGENLKLMDFAAGAKISGARFVVLYAELARLQRALTQLMLDTHTQEHGYQETYVPYLVNEASFYGVGQLPKFRDDLFFVSGESRLGLIPTAEVPVTNLVRDCLIDPDTLPLKWVAHTPCFRSEAGSYGRDTRGMIRNHQFEKIELVQIVKPEHSYQALEELTHHAETILQKLELPYRVVALCTGDLGSISAKTYDLEVWLPSQNQYREISSCSNFEAYHARRMHARWRNSHHGKTEPVHTLNGSGLAVGRTLVAILENFQDSQGQIHIPKVLQPYMNGLAVIAKK